MDAGKAWGWWHPRAPNPAWGFGQYLSWESVSYRGEKKKYTRSGNSTVKAQRRETGWCTCTTESSGLGVHRMERRVVGCGEQGGGSTGEMPTWDAESSQRRPSLSRLLHYPRVQSHLPWSMKEVLAMMGHVLREGPSPGNLPAFNTGEGHGTAFLTSTHGNV